MTDAVIIDLGAGPVRYRLPMARLVQVERECGDRSIIEVLEALSEGRGVAGHAAAVVRYAAPDPDAATAEFADRPLADVLAASRAILTATLLDVRLKPSSGAPGTRKSFKRGEVLATCGALGLDWERVGLGEYAEAVEAHNNQHSGRPQTEPLAPANVDRLKRIMAARAALDAAA